MSVVTATDAGRARLALGFFLLATALGWAAASGAAPQAWIGHVVPPWPPTLTHMGGSCINTEIEPCTVSLDLLQGVDGYYLSAAISLAPEKPSRARWQMTDIIAVPPIPDDYELAWGTCRHHLFGTRGASAIVQTESRQPIWAVAIAITTLNFVTVKPRAIDCPKTGPDH